MDVFVDELNRSKSKSISKNIITIKPTNTNPAPFTVGLLWLERSFGRSKICLDFSQGIKIPIPISAKTIPNRKIKGDIYKLLTSKRLTC